MLQRLSILYVQWIIALRRREKGIMRLEHIPWTRILKERDKILFLAECRNRTGEITLEA